MSDVFLSSLFSRRRWHSIFDFHYTLETHSRCCNRRPPKSYCSQFASNRNDWMKNWTDVWRCARNSSTNWKLTTYWESLNIYIKHGAIIVESVLQKIRDMKKNALTKKTNRNDDNITVHIIRTNWNWHGLALAQGQSTNLFFTSHSAKNNNIIFVSPRRALPPLHTPPRRYTYFYVFLSVDRSVSSRDVNSKCK